MIYFSTQVNFRNARGETALHLAARNELQKVVEVLVMAGADPLAEDNDRNKPIDLVAPEDTVSRQTLKTAMADRERIMNEAREVRAKGFTTSLQRELPLSARSQSTLNVPLAGMMPGALTSSRYMSHTGIFQPPAGMSYNQSGMMQGYGYQSGSRTSSSDSTKRRGDSNGGGPRLPPSMLNTSAGHLTVGVPPAGRPVAAMRKARSVEELDQPRSRQKGSGDGRQQQARGRKGSFQGSEVSSLWNVTPPGSINDLADVDDERAETTSKKSGRLRKVPKSKPHQNEIDEQPSPEVLSSRKKGKKSQPQPPPTKHKTSKHVVEEQEISDGNESEEYFLDDDDDDASSVDDLDVEVRPSKRAGKHGKPLPAVPEPTSSKGGRKKKGGKDKASKEQAGAHTWLDEQARILKERNRSEAVNPVAHSTPPATSKSRRRKEEYSSSSSETSSETTTESESESESDTSAPKGPPPPPPTKTKPAAKPKPPPPPKPSKDGRARHAPPLVQMENPGVGEMIQLDVDETQPEAQTVISIIPVNPPGPTRVEKVPRGSSSSTFVNLGKNASSDSPSTPSKHKKHAPSGGQKSRPQAEPIERRKNDRPVPRPREGKPTSTAAAAGKAPKPAVKTGKQQQQQPVCLLYTSPSPRDRQKSRMPSSA